MTSRPGIVMMRLQYSVTLAALPDVNDPSQSDPRIQKKIKRNTEYELEESF